MTGQGEKRFIPYGRQSLDEDDIAAVVEVLRSDWLTTGPKVHEFEQALAETAGTAEAVVVSNGTAALHAIAYAMGIQPGDEVIVTPITFASSANCVAFLGASPVFADVDPATLCIDPSAVERRITDRTKAIIAVDYAGQPCDYDALQKIADDHGLILIDDGCHAIGGTYKQRPVGSLAKATAFSFHPVKHVATGEGGAVATDDADFAARVRLFRNHGITTDFRQREASGSWFYEMVDLGFNYRLTDIQCALGVSQLKKLPWSIRRRQEIAAVYRQAFSEIEGITPLAVRPDVSHAYHLFVVQVDAERAGIGRPDLFNALRAGGIGVNVHYIPVHLHPFYRNTYGTKPGDCPVAEAAYERIISLPMYPAMTDDDVQYVIAAVRDALVSRG